MIFRRDPQLRAILKTRARRKQRSAVKPFKLKTHSTMLTATMMKLLRDAEDIRFSDYVFPGVNGGPMSDSTISKIMREIHNDEVNLGRSGFLDQQTGKRQSLIHI